MKILNFRGVPVPYPLNGDGTTIAKGALLSPGLTTTDSTAKTLSTLIISPATGALAIGIAAEQFLTASDSTPEDGLVYNTGLVEELFPGCELEAEYDLTSTVAVASATTTVVTITNLEVDIDGSWLYVTGGTGIGQLGFLTASASGSATLKDSLPTTLDGTSTVAKILREFHPLLTLTTNRTKLGSAAAAGAFVAGVKANYISYRGDRFTRLDPTKHHDLTNLNNLNVQFKSVIIPFNTFWTRAS